MLSFSYPPVHHGAGDRPRGDDAIRDQAVVPLHYQVNTWAARKPLTYEPRTDERTYAHDVRPGN